MSKAQLNKILYADDEYDIQTVVKLSLQTIGKFTVHTCNSAKIALQCMDDFDPDLFLFDVMMPEMDGPTLLGEVRKIDKFKDIPAVFITAKAQKAEIDHLTSYQGVAGVIIKPFNPVELPVQITEMWRQYYGL